MIETLFLTANEWITGGAGLALLGCFLWGMVSVLFSPCHMASIPLIVAYVAGQEKAIDPRQAVWYAGSFTLGLFITITLIGLVCSWLGRMLGDVGIWWRCADLGGHGHAGRGSLLDVRYAALPSEPQRSSRRIRAGTCLRCSVRILHVRVHRSDIGHCHRPAKDLDRNYDDYAVCTGTLSANCCCRQFNSPDPQADGKQVMAGRRQLVP